MTAADPILAALFKAVLADPKDDAVRLVYADRLEELGQDERAEFIRVQCELAKPCRLGYSDAFHVDRVCPACDPLYDRSRELVGRCPAPHAVHTACDGWDWRRGFVTDITLPLLAWDAHAEALHEATPLERVRLTGVEPYGNFIGEYGWFRRVPDVGDGGYHPQSNLPAGLFKKVRDRCHRSNNWSAHFPTREAAVAALLDACREAWSWGINFETA